MKKRIASFGEILWDCFPDRRVLGGAPYNFAYRVHSLGHESLMITRLGNDALGEEALSLVRKAEVDPSAIQTDEVYPTGTVDITLDEKRQPSYVINPNVAYDFIEPEASMLESVSIADCLCFGTLSQRAPCSRETLQTIWNASAESLKLYDVNLRKDCYSSEIITESLAVADILKLNEDEAFELAELFSLKGRTLPDLIPEMLRTWNLRECLVTLGDRGMLAASSDPGVLVYVPGYQVELSDPCGSGDACTAGYITSRLEGKSIQESGEVGNALGAIVATHSGATQPVSREECLTYIYGSPQRVTDDTLTQYML